MKKKPVFKCFSTYEGKTVNSATIDGYWFGERLLEGCKFIVSIKADRTLQAQADPEAKVYLHTLGGNAAVKKWEAEAVRYAEEQGELGAPFLSADGDEVELEPSVIPPEFAAPSKAKGKMVPKKIRMTRGKDIFNR